MPETTNVFEVQLSSDPSKADYYKEELGRIAPDAFFVLGGGNRKRKRLDGETTTSPYKGAFYPEKMGGAKARPIAAAELGKFYPDATIVTLSHRPGVLFQSAEQETQPAAQPFAEILAADLKRLKVGNEIIERPQPTSTLTEIMEAIILSVEKGWQHSVIVTNDYQIERGEKIVAMLSDDDRRLELKNQLQFLFATGEETVAFDKKWGEFEAAVTKFKESDSTVTFVSAENVLMKRSPHYRRLIEGLREENGYKNVVEQERIGIDKMNANEYNFAQPTFKEYVLSVKAA